MATRPRTFARLLSYSTGRKGLLAAALLASMVSAAAGAAFSWVLGPLLSALLLAKPSVQLGPLTLELGQFDARLPLALVALALSKAFAGWLHAGWMGQVAQTGLLKLRHALYQRLLWLEPRWLEDKHSAELLSRFTSDLALVEFALGQALSSWAKDALQVVALLAVCALVDVKLFLLAFLVLPAMVLPVSRFARALKKTAGSSQASLGALSTLAAEQLANLPVVQAFGAQPQMLKRFDEEQGRYLKVMKRSLFIRGAFTPTLELLGVAGVALCLVVGAQAVKADPPFAGRLISFLAAALLMYQPLKALSGTFAQVAQGIGAAQRLFEVIDAPLEAEGGAVAPPLRSALALEGVRVRHPDGRLGLDGVTLQIPAGKFCAVVGPSGAGKSTLLSLLLRFIGHEAGAARWDGAALESLSVASVRAQLAWVPQEPVLMSGSVRSNLVLGLEQKPGDEALWSALERAHASEFVKALPKQLEEEVGERGSRLSGGQRQRLAIARAFLREPSLLLLDEPTSALDAHAEAEVRAGLEALAQGRTALVVAHRLSTVRRADQNLRAPRGEVCGARHVRRAARARRVLHQDARGTRARVVEVGRRKTPIFDRFSTSHAQPNIRHFDRGR
ncbi:MAG: ABC transporter ATP-binding protein [Myxococcaceae bacterium]